MLSLVLGASPASAAVIPESDSIIDADAIASGRITATTQMTDVAGAGHGTISGHVFQADHGNPGSTADNGNSAAPDGTVVYLRWIDSDGAVSPIYKATTHSSLGVVAGNGGPGTFVFGDAEAGKALSWTDANGKVHAYTANAGQYYHLWVDPYQNATGNTMVQMRQAGGYYPSYVNSVTTSTLGQVGTVNGNMQKTAIFMVALASDYMKSANLVEDPAGPLGALDASSNIHGVPKNVVSGQVWLETGSGDRANVATGPNGNGPGLPVVGGTDQVAAGFTVYASTLTAEGAAANAAIKALPAGERAAATKAMLEANPQYILKTVYGKTDANGKYSLRFGDYTSQDQTWSDFMDPDNMYIWVVDPYGNPIQAYSPYLENTFQKYNANVSWTPQVTPGYNGVHDLTVGLSSPEYNKSVNKIYNQNLAVIPFQPAGLDITNYDVTDNPAKPGDVAIPKLTGAISPLPHRVEWTDEAGNILKTCDVATAADVAACTFPVPADLTTSQIYTASLFEGPNKIAADSFLAQVNVDATNFQPAYPATTVTQGATATVPVPTDVDGKPIPAGTTYGPGTGVPAWATVNPDGTITLTPGTDVPPGDYTIPVTVVYPDGSRETVNAPVKVLLQPMNEANDPTYPTGNGLPGATVTVPAPTNPDGSNVPAGSTFATTTPGMSVDPNTGVVTVPIPPDAVPGSTITGTVTVTYPDGTTDTITVTVTVDTPQKDTYDPVYPVTEVAQTHPATVPVPTDPAKPLPEGTTFAPGTGVPAWATVNPDGTITLTPGTDVPPGDYTIPVVVTYPDGTSETINAPVKVLPQPMNEAYAPQYPATDVTQTHPATVPVPTDPAKPLPEGTTFAPGTGVPAWATVNPDGTITLNPGTDVPPGDYTIPVVVTYPDGTSETINAPVKVLPQPMNEAFTPAYPQTNAQPTVPVTSGTPVFDATGTPATETDPAPAGTTYALDAAALPAGANVVGSAAEATKPGDVFVDPNTGAVTYVPTLDQANTTVFIPVVVTYSDATADSVLAPFVVGATQAETYAPQYPATDVTQTHPATVPVPTDPAKPLPEGTMFAPGTGVPAWATVNPDGTITLNPGTDVPPGDYTIPVVVTYPDGSSETINAPVKVLPQPMNEAFTPAYPTTNAQPTIPTDSAQPTVDATGTPATETDPAPAGTTYALDPAALPAGMTAVGSAAEATKPGDVFVDPDTGVVTYVPTLDQANTTVNVPVLVTYPDNTTDAATAAYAVGPNQAETYAPAYPVTEVAQTHPATVPVPTDPAKPLPEGTTFAPGTGVPAWATVNPDGTITLNPGTDVPPGDYTIPVVVTYPDGSIETIEAPVTVLPQPMNEAYAPQYPATDVTQTHPATVPVPTDPAKPLPEGTTFAPGTGVPAWATVNPDGTITLNPGTDVPPGDYTIPVVVTYPDGTSETINAPVTVLPQPMNEANDPGYAPGSGIPGSTVTVPAPTNPDGTKLPDDSTFSTTTPGMTVDPVTGVVTVPIPPDAVPGTTITGTVTVTYPDGTTDTITVTVTVATPLKDIVDPVYPATEVTQTKPATVPTPTDPARPIPAGTTFAPGTDVPTWAKVNSDGTITLTPGTNVKPGDYTIPVVVTYPDGSTETIEAPVTVLPQPMNEANDPGYQPGAGQPGSTVTIPAPTNPDGTKLPDGAKFSTTTPGMTVDPNTGVVTVTIPKDAKPGTVITGTITVTYPDGTTDEIPVKVTVGKAAAVALPKMPGGLAATGASVLTPLAVSLGLLLAGGFTLLLARRERHEQ